MRMKTISLLTVLALTCGLVGVAHGGLISHWAFDGDVLDSGSGGNDGTFVGGGGTPLTFETGFDGTPNGAITLDGNDYVDVAQNSGLPLYYNPEFTVAMWVKGPVQKDKRVFSESNSTGNNAPLFNLGTDNTGSTGKFNFFLRNDANQAVVGHRTSDREAFDNEWHHIAWTDNNGAVVLYIDGVRDAVDFSYTRPTLTITKTIIGGILRTSACCTFTGAIDDVQVHDVALTQAEVQGIMGTPAFCPGSEDPQFADTHLLELNVDPATLSLAGWYEVIATANDTSGDDIVYMAVADNGAGTTIEAGPTLSEAIDFLLTPGTWTVTVTVDDELRCPDAADDVSGSVEIVVDGTPQLISHWTLDATLDDAQPAGNHGTFVGDVAPTFVEGFDGTPNGAVQFDGTDDYIDVAQNGGLPIYATADAYTVALWVKGVGTQDDVRVFSEGSTVDNHPLFNIGTADISGVEDPNAGKVRVYIRGSSTFAGLSDRVAFDDTWHHIAWVDDGGLGILYIDGIRDAANMTFERPAMTTNTTTIGGILRGAPSHFFNGAIDDVRVYNYALSEEEVLGLVPEPETCPAEGDTYCEGLLVEGPEGNVEGTYTLTTSSSDTSEDMVLFFTYVVMPVPEDPARRRQIGPQTSNVATIDLTPGNWTISVTVDDDLACRDETEGATCTEIITVLAEPPIMVSHWALDGDLLDSEPAGNNGRYLGFEETEPGSGVWQEVEGTPTYVEGVDCTLEGAVEFGGDAAGQQVEIQTVTGLPISTRATFSIAMWVKAPAQGDKRVFSESSSTSDNPLFNIGTDHTGATGAVDLYIRADSGSAVMEHTHSTGVAFDDTWHLIVWTDNEGQAVLYIDGVADATDFTYTRGVLTMDTTTIGGIIRRGRLPGRNPACCMISGLIDDVRLYNYILSQDEIDALYGGGPSVCCPEDGDTHCVGLSVTGGPGEGIYTATCNAEDESGDPVIYTFSAADGQGTVLPPTSQTANVAEFDLTEGTWTITVTVDDDPVCPDEANDATCIQQVEVVAAAQFRRGDSNRDGGIDIADAIYTLSMLFAQGPPIYCPDAADANDDEAIDIADAIYTLSMLFAQGPVIPPPYPDCGIDTTGVPDTAPPGTPELDPCIYCPEACDDQPTACTPPEE